MSLIEERPTRKVRMAHLAVVGTHSTNGVAEIHSALLRSHVLKDFAEVYPERFSNKTNGVSPRRWLQLANPALSRLVTEVVGDRWTTDLDALRALAPFAGDAELQRRFAATKRDAKARFSDWLLKTSSRAVDPDTIFDCHIKRIHEYKRQLLNVLHVVILYNRLQRAPEAGVTPRTFLFAGKAAPAYRLAKLIVKLINNVAQTLDGDPAVRGRLRVLFLEDYNVSLAERLIPASDISEQISCSATTSADRSRGSSSRSGTPYSRGVTTTCTWRTWGPMRRRRPARRRYMRTPARGRRKRFSTSRPRGISPVTERLRNTRRGSGTRSPALCLRDHKAGHEGTKGCWFNHKGHKDHQGTATKAQPRRHEGTKGCWFNHQGHKDHQGTKTTKAQRPPRHKDHQGHTDHEPSEPSAYCARRLRPSKAAVL
jgi:hypothetical protein